MKIASNPSVSRRVRVAILVAALGLGATTARAQTLYGPTHYLSEADSPFLGTVCIEDFEDHSFYQPGVIASGGGPTSTLYPHGSTDSVDADDGVVDGLGIDGDAWWSYSPLTFTFDPAVLGSLPTRVGIVWTDGAGATTFEAFDGSGASLGTIGPVSIGDSSYWGTTVDDHFFGIEYAGGIGSISIACGSSEEVDHLQFSCPLLPSVETVRLGTPPNPNALRPGLTSGPALRATWDPWIDHASFAPASTHDVLAIASAPLEFSVAYGTLLVDPSRILATVSVPAGVPFAIPVPDTHSFIGLPLYAQGLSVPTIELTNALDVVLGLY